MRIKLNAFETSARRSESEISPNAPRVPLIQLKKRGLQLRKF
jgi:hypothetical protein